jgi:putative tricarboxylic transport membrane protein
MNQDLPNRKCSQGRQTHLDRSSALVFLILALSVGVEAYRLDPGKLGSPGPGLTPLLYASVLGVLSLILIVRSFRQQLDVHIVLNWRMVLPILSILLIYSLLIERLGYLVCTFLVMVVLFRIGRTGWFGSIIFGIGAIFVIHILFVRWLAVPLPRGFIFS